MLYCKGCECIIVPGRAFLTSGGYYCPHCMEAMRMETAENIAQRKEMLSDVKSENTKSL